MVIAVLAAGTSSRMGEVNKLLLPVNDMTMVANTCLEAVCFLETLNEETYLIVVTGYRKEDTVKALAPVSSYIDRTHSPVNFIITDNPDYENGQFSSTKQALRSVPDGQDFMIQLADKILITRRHYAQLLPYRGQSDVIRPFVGTVPGHPVLFSAKMKKAILNKDDSFTVSRILKNCDVLNIELNDRAFIKDVDTPSDL